MELTSFIFESFEPEKVKNGEWVLKKDLFVHLFTSRGYYVAAIKAGFKWNGASSPRLFQWVVPTWDKDKIGANVASCFHDAAFASKGFGGLIGYHDSTNIYRGMLRDSGYSRFSASAADFFIDKFACRHWGDDCYNVAHLVTLTKIH